MKDVTMKNSIWGTVDMVKKVEELIDQMKPRDWCSLNGRTEIASEIMSRTNKGENVEWLREMLQEACNIYNDPQLYVYDFGNKNVAIYTAEFIHLISDEWDKFTAEMRDSYICHCMAGQTLLRNGVSVVGDPKPCGKPLEKWRAYEDIHGKLFFEQM